MENGAKALIMAASVLLGVMIISVGVALFNSFAGSGSSIMSEIEKTQIAEFNTQFLKYYGKTTEENEKTGKEEIVPIKLTAHDVVTLANLAEKNNIEYDVQEQAGKSQNSYYVQVDVNKYKNFEKTLESVRTDFIQNNNMINNSNGELTVKYYYIKNVEISKITGRVIYVEIYEI